MFSRSALILSNILPALALVSPRHQLQERAGESIGGIFAGAPISNIVVKADNVNQCQTATISWTRATDPVSLFIASGGLYVGETPITTLNDLYGGSTTWLVDQAAGQTMEFRVTDAKGAIAYVQNIKIGQGESGCLSGSSSATAVSTASTRSSTAGPTSTWSEEMSSETPNTTRQPPEETAVAPASSSNEAARVVALSSSTPPRSSSSSTSSTSSTRSVGPSTISLPSASRTTSAVSTTSASPNASLANAGAAASASKTSGAMRDVAGVSGMAGAVFTGVVALGLVL